jgi:hypothetical protein
MAPGKPACPPLEKEGSEGERVGSPTAWLVVKAEGVHPIPSRTRKLSPPAPMVLRRRRRGRVGRRQPFASHKSPEGPQVLRGFLRWRKFPDIAWVKSHQISGPSAWKLRLNAAAAAPNWERPAVPFPSSNPGQRSIAEVAIGRRSRGVYVLVPSARRVRAEARISRGLIGKGVSA